MGDLVETRQNELQTKRICRFCLSRNVSELTNIYSKQENKKTTPLTMQVMVCASIEVFPSDSMPSLICNKCRLIFDYCYRFKQMCKKADTCLRHYPLTGMWATEMEHPKIPTELFAVKPKVEYKILNSPQITKSVLVQDAVKVEKPTTTKTPKKPLLEKPLALRAIKPKPHEIEIEIEEPEIEEEEVEEGEEILPDSFPKVKPAPQATPVEARKTTAGVKILNKSAIRILNKEAQKVIEPIMAKPVLKRDDDGNMAVVTQILEQDVNEAETQNTEILDTNVFPCPHCERSFPLQQLLDIHLVNHNRERSFMCDYCDKSFFSKYDLQKHNLTHTGEKPFKCIVCNKGFTRSTLLHRHEKTHIDIPKFICVFCEKSFISQEEMEKHTERHRKKRPYACRICNKAFAFKQGLERHEVVHCRNQPFKCQYCEQSFSTPSKLARHLTAHAGSRPYPCKLCAKSYLLSHHLSRHMRSHKNTSGLYKCSDCNKSFNNRDDLIYHSAVHAAQTMVCPLCKDAFEDIETVTEHVRLHAEGEAYACEFCDLIYMTADRLDEHIKGVHADEMAPYHEDNKKNAIANRNAAEKEQSSTREIDDEIEEFLLEEYPDESMKTEVDDNVIVKDENEWKTELENSINMASNSVESDTNVDDETLELMNMIEEMHGIEAAEPPAKVRKIETKTQEAPKIAIRQVAARRKPATKPVLATPKPAVVVNSTSPKENKKPVAPQKTAAGAKLIAGLKQVSVKSPMPKNRQPTIQDALRAIPQSVSVKKIETSNNKTQPATPVVTTPKPSPVERETTTRKSSPRVAAVKVVTTLSPSGTPQLNKVVTKSSPNANARTLRQRAEATTPETKVVPTTKASPTSMASIKKSPQKPVASDASKKTPEGPVEMMIGDKKVKVKKITMSKAQVDEMTRDGRIQMKGGTMILKKSRVEVKADACDD